jgi:predicted enzyme related to lactoylglutathione lyase
MTVLFVAVPASNLPRAIEWYVALFGRVPDIVPNDDEVMWQVNDGGWLYLVRDGDRAGRTVVTIAVDDLERALADLAARGVRSDGIEPVGDTGRKARLIDPEGNVVAVIEVKAG